MSLVVREVQMQGDTTILNLSSKMKGLIILSVGEDLEELEPSYTAGGNVNWYGHFGKQFKLIPTT